jgi:hypothetical protein
MKLAIGTLTVLLSMAAVASAEQANPFLCWPLSRVTGSSAIYDRPGGIEIATFISQHMGYTGQIVKVSGEDYPR